MSVSSCVVPVTHFTPYLDEHAHGAWVFSSTTWAAAFHLQWFILVYAVFLLDSTSGCEAYTLLQQMDI